MNAALSSLNTAVAHDARLEQIVEAAVGRWQAGEPVDFAAIAAAHPEYAAELHELLPTVARLVRLGDGPQRPPLVAAPSGAEPVPALQQLGDFRLVRELGRGGMGTVFEAEQISMGRRVALKVLPFVASAQEKSLQRFRNEVRAAAALDHPHIVSIYSVGEERGVHYFAMQLLRGQTLAELIEELRRQFPPPSQGREQPSTADPKSAERRAVVWSEGRGGTPEARLAAGAHPENGSVVENPSPRPLPSREGGRKRRPHD